MDGCNRLARIFIRTIKGCTEKPPALDFGVIQGDMGLLTDWFPVPIPQSDYMVTRSVQWGAVDDIFYKTQTPGKDNSGMHPHTADGTHPHGPSGGHSQESGDGVHSHPGTEGSHAHPTDEREMEHIHDTLVGLKNRWLIPGDRVLVAWVGMDDEGQIPVVIDIVYPATRIGRDANGYDK